MTSRRRAELLVRFAAHSANFDAQAVRHPPQADAVLPSPAKLLQTLSDRQVEVLQLVAGGLTNDEIADRLEITNETVKTHMVTLLARLGVRNRAGAVGAGFRAELIS